MRKWYIGSFERLNGYIEEGTTGRGEGISRLEVGLKGVEEGIYGAGESMTGVRRA